MFNVNIRKQNKIVLVAFNRRLLVICFLREAPERAIGSDRRAGKWGLVIPMRAARRYSGGVFMVRCGGGCLCRMKAAASGLPGRPPEPALSVRGAGWHPGEQGLYPLGSLNVKRNSHGVRLEEVSMISSLLIMCPDQAARPAPRSPQVNPPRALGYPSAPFSIFRPARAIR